MSKSTFSRVAGGISSLRVMRVPDKAWSHSHLCPSEKLRARLWTASWAAIVFLLSVSITNEKMFCSNNTTTDMTVKISAPFKLDVDQRKVFVDGLFINVAAPSGRQDRDYLYSASVTILRENNAVYTTAPNWASVDVEAMGAARSGHRDV